MAKYSIIHLQKKILSENAKHFYINDKDRDAIKEIIHFYNAIETDTIADNKLTTKLLLLVVLNELKKSDGKDIEQTLNEVYKLIISTNLDKLYDFVASYYDAKKWDNLSKKVGMTREYHFEDWSESDKNILEYNENEFKRLILEPFSTKNLHDLFRSMLAFIIQKSRV